MTEPSPGWHDDLQLATARMFYAAMGGDPNDPRRAQKVSKIQIALRDALTPDYPWKPVSEAPKNVKLVTCRVGERGVNLCLQDDDGEWHAPDGRSTVTHHSFAPPTHFIYVAALRPELTFPDHPVIPTTPLVFDDTAPLPPGKRPPPEQEFFTIPGWPWFPPSWGAWLRRMLSKLKDKPYESR